MMEFLASVGKSWHVGPVQVQALGWQVCSLWGMALDSLPPTDILSRPSPSIADPPSLLTCTRSLVSSFC